MKKMTKIILGSVTALAVVVSASGFAMAKHKGHGMMGDFMIYKLERQLDLNEAQLDQLKSIQEYVKTKRAEHSKEEHKETIKKLLAEPVLDQQQLISMLETRIQAMRGNAPEMISKIAAFTDGLSTEQRAELLEMMEKFGHRGRHRGKMMEQDQ